MEHARNAGHRPLRGGDHSPVHVEVTGRGAEPIMVLPGGGVRDPSYLGDTAQWGLGRDLAVVHFRGTPASGGIPGPWWDQYDDLEDVRHRLGLESVDILAHSAGSRVALAYAADGAPVRHIALVAPPTTWLTGRPDDVSDIAAARSAERVVVEALNAPPFTLDDEDGFRRHQRLTAPLGYARWDETAQRHAQVGKTDFRALQAFFGAAPPDELLHRISSLEIPIHVIGGAADLLAGRRSVADFASIFPRGTVEMIEGSGHFPWVEQEDAFREAASRWARQLETEEDR